MFTALVVAAAAPSVRPIDLAGRAVPLQIDEQGKMLVSGKAAGLAPAGRVFDARFDLTAEQAASDFALLVTNSENPSVTMNGRKVDIDPLPRTDGALLRISRMYLQSGTNSIEITRPQDEPDATWVGTAMFSLAGSFEEFHFGAAFSDTIKATPVTSGEEDKYDVISYDCSWTPSMSSSVLDAATVIMHARAKVTMSNVVMDFHRNEGQMIISSIDQGPATPPLTFNYDTPVTNQIRIDVAVPADSEFQVRIFYSGRPDTGGAFGQPYRRTSHGSPSTTLIYTFSEPYKARQWWPCKDKPDDKATTTVQRVTVPAGMVVVSNGKLDEPITDNGDGTRTWIWRNSYPISTYLVSITATNYVYSEATYTALDGVTTMPIKHAIYPENFSPCNECNGAAGTLQVMNYLRDQFGEYPFLSEKYYTATHASGSGMEHQTCTSMPPGSTAGVGDGFTRRNIHELAHQWFGDKITCANFDHVWLNEGFATYCEALWEEHASGKAAFHAWMDGYLASVFTGLGSPIVGPNADSFSSAIVYRRGAWVLHMLRHVVGDTAFFQGMRDFINDPDLSYATAVSSDFERIMETASGIVLDDFFRQWLYRPANGDGDTVPRYGFHASTSLSGGMYYLNLQVDQFQFGSRWFWMPLDFRVIDNMGANHTVVAENFTTTSATGTFSIATGTTQPVQIVFDPDNWVLKTQSVSINTVGLPDATQGVFYGRGFTASGGTTPYVWSLGAAAPGWITMSSGGTLAGTPPAAGVFDIPVTVRDNNGAGASRSVTLTLQVNSTDPPKILINEIDYDQNGPAPDTMEFVELYNAEPTTVNISGYKVEMINGSSGFGLTASTVTIPDGTFMASGDLYVIGGGDLVNKHLSFPGTTAQLGDGAFNGIRVKDSADVVLDAFLYETGTTDVTYTGPADTYEGNRFPGGDAESLDPGARGQVNGRGISIGRYPDGVDTNDNLGDFYLMAPTPAVSNEGTLALPYSNQFNVPGLFSAGTGVFESFIREEVVTLPAGTVPAGSGDPISPAYCLKVIDKSRNGDEIFFGGPGNTGSLYARGRWYLKGSPTNGAAAEMSGIQLRNTKSNSFFTPVSTITDSFGFESGVSVLYYAGAFPTQPDGVPAGQANKILVNAHVAGPVETDTNLAAIAMTGNRWVQFEILVDPGLNRLNINVDGTSVYNGVLPPGFPASGGIALGYRRAQGTPSADNGAFFDDLRIDATANAAAADFQLYE